MGRGRGDEGGDEPEERDARGHHRRAVIPDQRGDFVTVAAVVEPADPGGIGDDECGHHGGDHGREGQDERDQAPLDRHGVSISETAEDRVRSAVVAQRSPERARSGDQPEAKPQAEDEQDQAEGADNRRPGGQVEGRGDHHPDDADQGAEAPADQQARED